MKGDGLCNNKISFQYQDPAEVEIYGLAIAGFKHVGKSCWHRHAICVNVDSAA